MPKSFTYGEASVVVQGFVIFLANLYFKLIITLALPTDCTENGNEMCSLVSNKNSWIQHSVQFSEIEQLSTILQVLPTKTHEKYTKYVISVHVSIYRLVCWV